MASQITQDGQVVAPLNISAPAPIISLRGFQWSTVDSKILGPQPSKHHKHDDDKDEFRINGDHPAQEIMSIATAPPSQRAAAAAPAAASAALPAPRLPLSSTALPGQLPGQLGHIPGKAAPALPDFPLEQFQGAYAGNGFNTIFRPRAADDQTHFDVKPTTAFPFDDNILELNLTTEQLTFGGTIGDIPNRGLNVNKQPDIHLGGFPYLQTVQDVTYPKTGKGDNPIPTGIHFEPGMWLTVPKSDTAPQNAASVVRMASIPHGTTINAQGLAPSSGGRTATSIGGVPGGPTFDTLDTTPFGTKSGTKQPFDNMNPDKSDTFRIPQDLTPFVKQNTITKEIILNPNLVLKKAIANQTITETITFEVSTGAPTAKLNGGGTANISFLAGKQNLVNGLVTNAAPDAPNAHANLMTAKYWIESVVYDVIIPVHPATETGVADTVLLKPKMDNPDAPTPVFAITLPKDGNTTEKTIKVPGIQIQSSQTVNLVFGPLTWPHVSVSTLVPSDPQPFTMA